jgi:hypothetical protein
VATLDSYRERLPPGRLLIKVDTEGSETRVLAGARSLLRDRRPIVLFESLPSSHRKVLVDLLDEQRYEIHPLPWSPGLPSGALDADEFSRRAARNFAAIPVPDA